METRVLENPTVEDIECATTSMFEKGFILYKKVRLDDLLVLYFKFEDEV